MLYSPDAPCMQSLADFGRASGLLYDDVPRDGGPARTRMTREGALMGVLGALALLIGLAAIGVLAATFVNSQRLTEKPSRDTCTIERSLDGSLDDRCAPCEQANMQQRLNEFVRWESAKTTAVFGAAVFGGSMTLSLTDVPTDPDPLFPELFHQTWDEIYARAVSTIDPSLLDPYDAIAFTQIYLRPKFYGWYANQTAQTDICQKRAEDWLLANTPLTIASSLFGGFFAAPPVPASTFGALILDSATFNYYVDQLEQAISPIRRRVTGDWWTAVYQRTQANGGILRSPWVTGTLNAVAADIALANPVAAPQPIKLFVAMSGYVMTPAEEARLDDVIRRYHAAQEDFLLYSLMVTPPLVDSTPFNTWALNYGWTACFGYTNGLWYYGTNESELMSMFLDNKAWTESMITDLQAKRDALWPADAWLPWQQTYLHYVFPEGLPNGMGITGWGFNPTQCNTINPATGAPLFGDTLARSVARYYNDRYKLYNAANGPLARHLPTTSIGGCAPFAGNAGTSQILGPQAERGTPPLLILQNPIYTKNFTYSVVIHEQKHAAQSGTSGASACPTCYGNFMLRSTFSTPPTVVTYPFSFSDFIGLTFVEGPAVFAEEQAVASGLFTEWEAFHVNMSFVQTRQMMILTTTGIRLGYWDLAGALAWMNQWSWFPNQFSPTVIQQNALREMVPSVAWYGLGWWYTRMYNTMAKAACGDAFNQQAFNQLTHTIPQGPVVMWRALLDNYIANNCTTPTTRFGDARRTVVAPSLRGM